ncbi:uncharacterized protein LOC120348574 [Styela clava]
MACTKICLCILILFSIISCSSSEVIAKTGREYRKLYPRRRGISGIQSTLSYSRHSRSPDLRRRPRAFPRISRYRSGYFPGSPIRRSLFHVRHQPQQAILARPTSMTHNYTSNPRTDGTNFYQKSRKFSQTKAGNNRMRFNISRPKKSNPTTSLTRQRKYLINKCKNIKIGKCCQGWSHHALTGYCLPSCSESCVHGTCENSHTCKCRNGFLGPLCNIDENECAKDVCEHGCLNTYGSYKCICDEGFLIQSDGSCKEIPPCDLKQCEYKCYVDSGDAKCVCPRGYRISEDGRSCKDINECTERDIKCNQHDEFRFCKNLPGSYICSCKEGFFYHRYFKACTDSNECLLETHDCDTNISRCVNTNGGYKCVCRENYTGDGKKCQPIRVPNRRRLELEGN